MSVQYDSTKAIPNPPPHSLRASANANAYAVLEAITEMRGQSSELPVWHTYEAARLLAVLQIRQAEDS